MKIRMNNTERIRKMIRKSILIIAKNFFKDCLVIIFLTIIIALICYYKYNKMIKGIELEPVNESLVLDRFNYKEVIKHWRDDEDKIKKIDKKQYKDIFQLKKEEEQK